jgi:hypothetical protein
MKRDRKSKFQETPSAEILLLRERLGMGKYRKTRPRDEEKTRMLIRLALIRMEESEKTDFIKIGNRKRRLKMS